MIGQNVEENIEIKDYIKVNPIIVYPACIKAGKKQDCFNCQLFKKSLCHSPRSLCVASYPDHKKGCPNYGKYPKCPPNIEMFDEIFDMKKPVYLIYIKYDIEAHINKMKDKHPNWTDRQLRNVLYWQGTAKKTHRQEVKKFLEKYGHLGYEVATPEALGVDVTKTLENAGIILEWPPMKYSYRIAFAGVPKESMTLKRYEGVINENKIRGHKRFN